MITKTLKWAAFLALSCGLFACGQPKTLTINPTSTIQTAAVSSQKQSSEASSKPKNATIAASPNKSEPASTNYSVDKIYTEFERLTQRVCQKQEKIVGNFRYTLCTTTNPQGIITTVSASSSLVNEGDGAEYWLNENGDIYAIHYFHDNQVVVLLPEDKKTIVELARPRDRESKVIIDEARWNGLELSARDQIMKISEQFDLAASTQQTSDNSDRQEVEQIALRSLTPGALAGAGLPSPTIQRLAIVDDTALLIYQRGEMGGMMLLRKERGMWRVLTKGGGAISLMTLSEYNVPRTTGQALLNQLNLN